MEVIFRDWCYFANAVLLIFALPNYFAISHVFSLLSLSLTISDFGEMMSQNTPERPHFYMLLFNLILKKKKPHKSVPIGSHRELNAEVKVFTLTDGQMSKLELVMQLTQSLFLQPVLLARILFIMYPRISYKKTEKKSYFVSPIPMTINTLLICQIKGKIDNL